MAASPAQIQKYLGGMDYPASKDDLINHAKSKGADSEIIDILSKLPGNQYNSANDVSKAIGQVE